MWTNIEECALICSYSKTTSFEDVTRPWCSSAPGPTAAENSFSLFGGNKTGSYKTFSCYYMEQSFRAALTFHHVQPQWWIWCLKPNFLLFWTPTKTNLRNLVTSFITSEELLQQLLTILGHRYSSSKLHIHLSKRNLMTFLI